MTSFERHLQHGVSVHLVAVAIVSVPYAAGYLPDTVLVLVLAAFPFTLAGAVVPDLDHHQSAPYRLAERYLPLVAGMTAVALGMQFRALFEAIAAVRWLQVTTDFAVGVGVSSAAWVTWSLCRWLLPRLRPPHRTVTHRPVTGLVLSLCTMGVVLVLLSGTEVGDPILHQTGIITGVMFLLGFGSHLAADGVFESVRLRLEELTSASPSSENTEND
jgi:uncharacterized metal-binding protein